MNNPDDCPNCGAESCYHKLDPVTERPAWFGIGLDESCKLCGADYEYSIPNSRKPLSKRPIEYLLQEARDVERVYARGLFMTHEQITKNREYFQSIIDVIASANKNHISDRFGKGHTAKLHERMIALYAQVNGGPATRALIKYGDNDLDDVELHDEMARLQQILDERRAESIIAVPSE